MKGAHEVFMGAYRWMKSCLIALALLTTVQVSHAADSTLISKDTRIEPVLVLANYAFGPCAQEIASRWARPLGFLDSALINQDKLRQMPTYILCRHLPQALIEHMLAHHVDATLQELDTEPLKADAYAARLTAFRQQALMAQENAKRYVLEYNGADFNQGARSTMIIFLLSPVNGDGSRTELGYFDLSDKLYVFFNANTFSNTSSYRLLTPDEVAERIVASLEERCAAKGIFGDNQPCPDRYHLSAPRK